MGSSSKLSDRTDCSNHSPSMGLILYGTVGEVSIGRLFVAGFVPGIIMCVLMMIATSWSARHLGYQPDHEKPSSLHEIVKCCVGKYLGSSVPDSPDCTDPFWRYDTFRIRCVCSILLL